MARDTERTEIQPVQNIGRADVSGKAVSSWIRRDTYGQTRT